MSSVHLEPLTVVGVEGILGTAALLLILMPIVQARRTRSIFSLRCRFVVTARVDTGGASSAVALLLVLFTSVWACSTLSNLYVAPFCVAFDACNRMGMSIYEMQQVSNPNCQQRQGSAYAQPQLGVASTTDHVAELARMWLTPPAGYTLDSSQKDSLVG